MATFKCSIFGILMLILIINTAAADKYASSKQLLKVDFELPLDVRELDSAGYKAFQANLRTKLAARYIGPATNNVAVLPPDDQATPRWFDLKLTGIGGTTTTVRFRVGNLYVVGYQMPTTPTPTWFELGKTGDKQWIPNSKFLGFRGDYPALEAAAKKKVTAISLTSFGFQAAVKTLATVTGSTAKGDERAEALILVAQMVSEACRFVVLSNYLASKLATTPNYLPEWVLVDLERKWGTYSEILLCYNEFPTSYKFPKQTINGKDFDKADDLRKLLGILLNVQVGKVTCKITANEIELSNIIDFQAQLQNPVELAGVEA